MIDKQILDPCCGSKMFYFDKSNPEVLFCDVREEEHLLCDGRKLEIKPDMLMDFRDMPFVDKYFNLIIWDPPHLHTAGENSWIRKKYGCLNKEAWQDDLRKGFDECWRVLAKGGTLIFKWAEVQIKVSEILACFAQEPLVGCPTTRNLKTHWQVFYKGKE